MKALAVIDGEHYADVVRDALVELPYDFVAAYLAGGEEKLRGGEDYGVPVVQDLDDGLAFGPEVVVDLSDEPVLGPRARLLLASRVLARGLAYVGPDFRFEPPLFAPFSLPSLGVAGTGKRVGKTAVANHVARLLSREHDVVVVAMGRGGPPGPELVTRPPTAEELLALSRAGQHAASDYLEDAVLSGVRTVGARRCGGGLAGRTAASNVLAAAELAAELGPDLVLFEGSGAALPPVATDRRILVAPADEGADVTGGLNAYRVLISDLVVLVGEEGGDAPRAAVDTLRPDLPVVAVTLRPRPTVDVAGRRAVVFTTAQEPARAVVATHVGERHGAEVVHVSGNLARRDELRRELDPPPEADVYLTELKAAAIDVVAEAAVARGVELGFLDNEVVPLPGEADLDDAVQALARDALARTPLPA